jgi:hypothetical protein
LYSGAGKLSSSPSAARFSLAATWACDSIIQGWVTAWGWSVVGAIAFGPLATRHPTLDREAPL